MNNEKLKFLEYALNIGGIVMLVDHIIGNDKIARAITTGVFLTVGIALAIYNKKKAEKY